MDKGELVANEIVVMVPRESFSDRVVGPRLDSITGRRYHLTYSPRETEEIVAKLTRCFDDTVKNGTCIAA
ncbi:putative adenylate kinase [Helianthus anomalus]